VLRMLSHTKRLILSLSKDDNTITETTLRAVHPHFTERTDIIAAHFRRAGLECIRRGIGQQRL
jgi:hypothetical protein